MFTGNPESSLFLSRPLLTPHLCPRSESSEESSSGGGVRGGGGAASPRPRPSPSPDRGGSRDRRRLPHAGDAAARERQPLGEGPRPRREPAAGLLHRAEPEIWVEGPPKRSSGSLPPRSACMGHEEP